MKELAALAYRDTTAENREFWKNEMGQAMREIQQVYEDKLDTMRSEVEASYSLKVTELFVSTLWVKKVSHPNHGYNCQFLIDLQNSFTAANSYKFQTKPILAYPPHLKSVVALTWET